MTDLQPKPILVKTRVKGILMNDSQAILHEVVESSKKFCETVGLQKNLITQIIETDNDWALILKVDALLEVAAKEILRKHLHVTLANGIENNKVREEFIDALPLNGRTSVLRLLEAAGCPEVHLRFIEAARKVRNAYAHNVRNLNVSLIELIKRLDRKLLERLSLLQEPADEMFARREKNAKLLRVEIVLLSLRFLCFAYDEAIKPAK
jgi:hypothetical protein